MTLHEAVDRYLASTEALLMLRCDPTGSVVEANPAAQMLMQGKLGAHFSTWAADASAEPIDPAALAREPTCRHRINFLVGVADAVSLYFRFFEVDDEILVLGEQDVGESLALRDDLMAVNQELNNMSRTLHQQAAELKRLSETKNSFLGMAAHDLRTPLGAIHGYSRLVRRAAGEVLPAKQLGLLDRIEENSRFMLRLVNDLLDITTIESGKLTLNIDEVDVLPILRRSIESNAVAGEHKGVKVRLSAPEIVARVCIDAVRTEQVLNNLLSNAVKFSRAGTCATVTVYERDADVIVEIADEGPGIPKSEQAGLFGEFVRSSVRSTAGEKSTGLGLAIAKKIVLAQGGRIWLESDEGTGSTFAFTLSKCR